MLKLGRRARGHFMTLTGRGGDGRFTNGFEQ